MEIPWKALDEEILTRLVDEVVTRDGTDYGANEKSREQKVQEVRRALESNRAVIYWDADSETASIQSKDI